MTQPDLERPDDDDRDLLTRAEAVVRLREEIAVLNQLEGPQYDAVRDSLTELNAALDRHTTSDPQS
jgi:hypothetical protein